MQTDHWPADAVAAVTHPDPYPYYATLAKDRAPRHDARLGLWVAAHPDTVREVLAHPDCRVRPAHEPVPLALAGPAGSLFGALVRMNEGERHVAPKAALQRALAALPPALVAGQADRVAAGMAAETSDAAALNAFVAGVPVRIVAGLLGFADRQLPQVAAWVGAYVACLSPLASAGDIAAAHGAAAALQGALRELVQAAPAHGLLADVLGKPWYDEHALLANLAGLLAQTHEATAGLLGNCIVARLRGAADDTAALVPLVAASDPAIHNTRRFTSGAVAVGGAHVPAGQAILLVLAGSAGFGHG
ncbi:MAG TPA: cytochrome P450, partial [Pseudoduganella sp.]